MQPEFFPVEEITNEEIVSRLEVSRRICGMLSAMRRKAAEFDREREFVADITKWLEQTRAKGRQTPTQIEGQILYAIERQQAETLTEICEELNLDRKFVENKLNEMIEKSFIRKIKKYVPLMYKHTYLYKSNRLKTPEAG